MKKLLLLFVASVLAITGAKAEVPSTLVATLLHDGKLQMFYGENALSQSYEAAADGDVITLSAGRFNAVNMDKSITVRGSGMTADASTDNAPTYLNGGFTVKLKEGANEFTLEGVYCDESVTITEESSEILPVNISKCYFYKGLFLSSNTFGKISHCILYGYGEKWDGSHDTNYLEIKRGICQNCNIKVHSVSSPSPVTFQNCVIRNFSDSFRNLFISYFKSDDILTNCLIIGNGSRKFNIETSIHSCVGFCSEENIVDFFENVTNNSNKMVSDRDNFFKDSSIIEKKSNSSYSVYFSELSIDGTGIYELSDDAKQIYKGNDGTVVGVWGGTTPFNMTPTNPRVTNCEIRSIVKDDGNLNIYVGFDFEH